MANPTPLSHAPQTPRRRDGQYGGILSKMMGLLVIITLLIGVNAYFTLGALQGQWQLTLSDGSAKDLTTLMNAGVEDMTGRKTLRDTLRDKVLRGLGNFSGAVLKSAANQVVVGVDGGDFRLADDNSVAAAAMLTSLVAQSGREPVECKSGSILAFFPLMQVTCRGESKSTSIWFIMRDFPKETMRLFPVPVGQDELEKYAANLQDKSASAEDVDMEKLEAVRELFTLHFKKVP